MAARAGWCGLLLAAAPAVAQEGFELLLRDGSVVVAQSLAGDLDRGFEATVGGSRRQLAAGELLAVQHVAAVVPALPAAWLAGGDVLYGAVVGGDAAGNRLELLSPVLGRVPLPTDRVAALAAPGVAEPLRLQLPGEVGEALFVRAKVGFDVIAGTLHQFGEPGVRFQPEGSASPRWYALDDLAALRLGDAQAREGQARARLLTRAGDRLALDRLHWTAAGLQCGLEGGANVVLRPPDLAALAFPQDVVFLSDLAPTRVEESGYDGEVVHAFRRDHNALGGPLVTAGRSAAKGLGVHSRSRLVFRVPEGMERFCVRVGFDDSVVALRLEPHVEVRVLVGDKVAFASKDLALGRPPLDTGLLAVRSGDTIALEVDHGRGRDVGDRVNWLAPVFLPAAARRP